MTQANTSVMSNLTSILLSVLIITTVVVDIGSRKAESNQTSIEESVPAITDWISNTTNSLCKHAGEVRTSFYECHWVDYVIIDEFTMIVVTMAEMGKQFSRTSYSDYIEMTNPCIGSRSATESLEWTLVTQYGEKTQLAELVFCSGFEFRYNSELWGSLPDVNDDKYSIGVDTNGSIVTSLDMLLLNNSKKIQDDSKLVLIQDGNQIVLPYRELITKTGDMPFHWFSLILSMDLTGKLEWSRLITKNLDLEYLNNNVTGNEESNLINYPCSKKDNDILISESYYHFSVYPKHNSSLWNSWGLNSNKCSFYLRNINLDTGNDVHYNEIGDESIGELEIGIILNSTTYSNESNYWFIDNGYSGVITENGSNLIIVQDAHFYAISEQGLALFTVANYTELLIFDASTLKLKDRLFLSPMKVFSIENLQDFGNTITISGLLPDYSMINSTSNNGSNSSIYYSQLYGETIIASIARDSQTVTYRTYNMGMNRDSTSFNECYIGLFTSEYKLELKHPMSILMEGCDYGTFILSMNNTVDHYEVSNILEIIGENTEYPIVYGDYFMKNHSRGITTSIPALYDMLPGFGDECLVESAEHLTGGCEFEINNRTWVAYKLPE